MGATCLSCTIPNFLTAGYASGAWTCNSCAVGYISNGVGGCSTCSTYMNHCLECSSQTICTQCDASVQYYLNTSDNKCATCNIVGCTTCKSLTTCLTCNTAGDYFIDAN
jgi:hypothetical protein